MKKMFSLPKSSRGQSLVEPAVSLVSLLNLLSGAVKFGIIFFQLVQLRDADEGGGQDVLQQFNSRSNANQPQPIITFGQAP